MVTEKLLLMCPHEALKTMAIDRFKIPRKLREIRLEGVRGEWDKEIATAVFTNNSLYTDPKILLVTDMPYVFEFNRLNLDLLNLNGPLHISLNPYGRVTPFWKLIQEHFHDIGIKFNATDFKNIIPAPVVDKIQATNHSARWYGELNVVFEYLYDHIAKSVLVTDYNLPFGKNWTPKNFKRLLTEKIVDWNSSLRKTITEGDFIIEGNPRQVANGFEFPNTEISLKFIKNYVGNIDVRYSRQSLEQTYMTPPEVAYTGILSKKALLDELSERYNCALDVSDFESFEIPNPRVGFSREAHLKFKDNNLCFVGRMKYKVTHVPKGIGL